MDILKDKIVDLYNHTSDTQLLMYAVLAFVALAIFGVVSVAMKEIAAEDAEEARLLDISDTRRLSYREQHTLHKIRNKRKERAADWRAAQNRASNQFNSHQ